MKWIFEIATESFWTFCGTFLILLLGGAVLYETLKWLTGLWNRMFDTIDFMWDTRERKECCGCDQPEDESEYVCPGCQQALDDMELDDSDDNDQQSGSM